MPLAPTRFIVPLKVSVCSGRAARRRGVPPTENIPNFAEVDADLFRSAQPDQTALVSLVRRGVKSIINLRMPDDVDPSERAFARAHHIAYTHVPLPGLRSPTDEQIERLFVLVASMPSPVLAHCEHGADRTGTFVACYRILLQGWSAKQALAEADRYGMSNLVVGMRHFVRRFQANLPEWHRALARSAGGPDPASSAAGLACPAPGSAPR